MAVLETYENIEMAVRPSRIVIDINWGATDIESSKVTFRAIRQSTSDGEVINPRALGFSFGGDKITPEEFGTVFAIFSKYFDAYLKKEAPFEVEDAAEGE